MVISLISLSKLAILTKKEYCQKLPLILLKSEGGEIQTESKMKVAAKWRFFYNCRNKLFNGNLVLRFGAAPLLFMFVVFSS